MINRKTSALFLFLKIGMILFGIRLLWNKNKNKNNVVICVIAFFVSAGGIELTAKGGKIKVANTLEERLELLSRQVCFGIISVLLYPKIFDTFFPQFIFRSFCDSV